MMRRNLVLFALLGAFAFPFEANAEVLRWFVNSNPVYGTDFSGATGQRIDWEYAVLRATIKSSSNEAIYGGTGAPIESMSYPEGTQSGNTGVMVQNYVGESSGLYTVDKDTFGLDSGSDVQANLDSLAALGLDKTALSFYVELYDSSNILVGYSSAQSYTALQEFRNESRYFTDWNTYTAWNAGDWTAVPEPTSGMLALLGLVALGLRRRRV